MPQKASAATDLHLITYLKAITYEPMRRGVRIPARYLLRVAGLGDFKPLPRACGIWSVTPDGDGFAYAIRHHSVLTETLGLELRRPSSDSAIRSGKGVNSEGESDQGCRERCPGATGWGAGGG